MTWTGDTVIYVNITQLACKSTLAGTEEAIFLIIAGPTIVTRKRCTFVDLRATIVTRKAWGTFTTVAVYSIATNGSIVAIVLCTLVNVNLTMGSTVSITADAGIIVQFVNARGIIVTRRTSTFVDVHTAVFACIT